MKARPRRTFAMIGVAYGAATAEPATISAGIIGSTSRGPHAYQPKGDHHVARRSIWPRRSNATTGAASRWMLHGRRPLAAIATPMMSAGARSQNHSNPPFGENHSATKRRKTRLGFQFSYAGCM